MTPKRGAPVCVAMSGGVDSAVVAYLLKKRGYDVVGITMQIWQESQRDPRHAGCCSLGAVEDARRSARMLDIPHYVINFKDQFKQTVIDEFVREYAAGRTPNPCVTCNKKVKFEAMLQKSQELGCEALATGHYARLRRDPKTGLMRLMRARGIAKDQSYVLYGFTQAQMEGCYFPLGEMPDKAETRRLAREAGLPVADKPDSQEICFVSEAGGYREFLRKSRPDMFEEGELITVGGERLGTHQGVADFTVGQRRGLGVAKGKPLYVIEIQPDQNRVVVGTDEDLKLTHVRVPAWHWTSVAPTNEPLRVQAKIRYNMAPQPATLRVEDGTATLTFDQPVRAVTPGQIAVAYRGETVIGGGNIE
ncbi:MAG TPA: tRNA 2-thiouridine(34) synthase MnmA [Fimbriimonadaceae bacterium]|nr:tRNA 2-thiouridine(34) synthase MnmA [Armatimonadota bacterium]HCM73340.1 tRNA 2-thiouridine(34) synthase MnmA [Armatimonadota bacterium]HRD32072.1 tRNA 2-thiouridine(34) synthase MnmA [Fimbriimonadaceae bacterium]HRE93669.1 tRNA 2-thiouridine(34) synthase MnmA [Fimbriimonadaceae bacterium]HRI73746.1 tRNA 2-thiouridine(34) synthase MnmA [Fimbriimonadaceae bacterium]